MSNKGQESWKSNSRFSHLSVMLTPCPSAVASSDNFHVGTCSFQRIPLRPSPPSCWDHSAPNRHIRLLAFMFTLRAFMG